MNFKRIFCFLCLIQFANATPENITPFLNDFSVRLKCNYNFLMFYSSELQGELLQSNRPVDVGLGFGYKTLYFDFIYALPFTVDDKKAKSLAFETTFDFFPGNWWLTAKYRRYSGFSEDFENENKSVDLWQRDAYVQALYMASAKDLFTPRAAYFLDFVQNVSAGSLILGGKAQSSKIKDYDGTLPFYTKARVLNSIWANFGYTYTFIFENKKFINLLGLLGIACGKDFEGNETSLLPDANVKIALGKFGETLSFNVALATSYSSVLYEEHVEQKIASSFEILVVRRF